MSYICQTADTDIKLYTSGKIIEVKPPPIINLYLYNIDSIKIKHQSKMHPVYFTQFLAF